MKGTKVSLFLGCAVLLVINLPFVFAEVVDRVVAFA